MLAAGSEYTEKFLEGAQQQLKRMQQYFLVQDFELKPQIYIKVTTNWVGLTMRYVVDPKKRRAATTFLYRNIFDQIRERDDIQIGTDTMEVTYKTAEEEERKRSGKKSVPEEFAERAESGDRRPTAEKRDEAAEGLCAR